MRILVVDDDVELAGLVDYALRQAGFAVSLAYDGPSGLAAAQREQPDLLILDVNLPGMDGFGVLKALRVESDMPVLMLTVRNSEDDEVRGLDLGADDYLGKPFSPRTLLARVRALLRRHEGTEARQLGQGRFRLDTETLEIHDGSRAALRLTPLEARLMQCLLAREGRPVNTAKLVGFVWAGRDAGDREDLKQLVHRCRHKLEQHFGRQPIATVPHVGYCWAEEDTTPPE